MNTNTKPHLGRNISRLRELRGMKQFALAEAIGVTQQTISHIESSETVDEQKLQQIAEVLGVTVEAIKKFSDEAVFNIINSFNDADFSNSNGAFGAVACNFNPLDKVVELYERLLQAEREKIALLEQLKK